MYLYRMDDWIMVCGCTGDGVLMRGLWCLVEGMGVGTLLVLAASCVVLFDVVL